MKRPNLVLIVMFIQVIFYYSCSEHNQNSLNDETTIIYERNSTIDEVSMSILDNHVVKIEKIGQFNKDAKQLFETKDWETISKFELKLDFENILRYSYDHSPAKMISIPLGDCYEKSLILYEFDNQYVPAIAHTVKTQNGYHQFYLYSLDGEVYYKVMLSPENTVGNFEFLIDIPFEESFGRSQQKSMLLVKSQTCPESTETFGGCMLCGIDECAEDWICAVVCTLAPRECLAGFAIGCIFFN